MKYRITAYTWYIEKSHWNVYFPRMEGHTLEFMGPIPQSPEPWRDLDEQPRGKGSSCHRSLHLTPPTAVSVRATFEIRREKVQGTARENLFRRKEERYLLKERNDTLHCHCPQDLAAVHHALTDVPPCPLTASWAHLISFEPRSAMTKPSSLKLPSYQLSDALPEDPRSLK